MLTHFSKQNKAYNKVSEFGANKQASVCVSFLDDADVVVKRKCVEGLSA